MALKPLLDKVVLKPEKAGVSSKSGLLIASKSKDHPIIATVESRGPGGIVDGKEIKMYINEGDKVVVNKYAGTEVSYEGTEYIIVSQKDILAHIV
ncbi:MAG: co-chaperone GroES [Candidatus Improbicoccus devescovinae]|nr:MAG: co-chaperone GroES [Candidatus Improbicoccus devescovinae]